jgi:hypothetical protein
MVLEDHKVEHVWLLDNTGRVMNKLAGVRGLEEVAQ